MLDAKNPPTCKNCYKKAILANAGVLKAIEYFYCRTCKIEVDGFGYAVLPKAQEPDKYEELSTYLAERMADMDEDAGEDDSYLYFA